ncbi:MULTISPECIES: putative Fe-S cluster assembly protein SufT [Myxococcus]|uniref:Fe-S cluster assembly protein SufT n=1 Tax=Myxococcus xanthus TaxID=34 RepID=A0AAE6G7A0_MYXXA|nr:MULTISPECIES: putative Fe-S cluster assembly protein SufT [Myxococcus]QDE72305.1 putative Fe-S cluster assembly protein SufT [Myxococcus xanthus]QDE79588.1 putative Fe-S cluster assembly protein SufT [Myxococcus xanthus]QDE86950.1 putative Fe-S cluster assembly protein SufT [Myxococcus xanthus]QDF01113.1 putative Fe-S cluster assembly protein SufT [Myxococcus xanthus]QDF02741.1 putative Fe-S cluster assembly protein SufT [Myxococcus xanthus]
MRGMMAVLERDVSATIIPSGDRVVLPGGSELRVMQTLGGNITVQDPYGQLFRIDEKDGGVLGEEYAPKEKAAGDPSEFNEEQVWEQLRTVYDPEIPVNIVELGLVYACKAEPLPEGGQRVDIQMTLTAPGCGMGPVLVEDVRTKVGSVPGVVETRVELVWDPPWGQDRMSDVARLQLGWM